MKNDTKEDALTDKHKISEKNEGGDKHLEKRRAKRYRMSSKKREGNVRSYMKVER